MSVECFFDTNILIYAVSRAEDDSRKHAIARDLVSKTEFAVSAQVLQEFFVVATSKIRLRISNDEAEAFVKWLSRMSCVPLDAELVLRGIEIARRYQLKYWDGAILAATEYVNAKILYSEDLSSNQLYGSVRVVNPFLSS